MKKIKIVLLLLATLATQPAWAAKELIYGISNDAVLLSVLGSGILILFACILTMAYMLYKSIPGIMQKRLEDDRAGRANQKS